jgi:hypothetical protein
MTELVVATESNFSEKCYLAVNRDVAAAIESGAFTSGFDHFSKLGKFESRLQVADVDSEYFLTEPLTRMIFGQEIESDPRDSILEIGPLNKPLITGKKCKYFDLFDQNGMQKRALEQNLDPQTVPHIDFFEKNGDLSVIHEKFDSVFSAHCIEHQPDLIKHLNQVSKLCKAIGSKYWAIIPDKRYCFDHFFPESRVTEIIQAHEDQRVVPRKLIVLEHLALTTHNDAGRHWRGDHGNFGEDVKSRWAAGLQHFNAANGGYVDVHCWQFTPKGFFDSINLLFELGYIDFKCTRYHETAINDLEFYAVLEKKREFI